MVVFSSVAARAAGADSESEEEPGEVIDSIPLLKVGEEREFRKFGYEMKLLNEGVGWQTPSLGDEVTVHCVVSLLDGSKFVSTRCNQEPPTFKLGHGRNALFTLPPDLAYGVNGADGGPPNSVVLFEVELASWLNVVDVCKDGGIVKKVLSKGLVSEQPSNLDQVTVKFEARLLDGPIIAKTPDEGVEFYLNDDGFGEQGCDGFYSVPPNSTLVICLELVSIKPVINVTGNLKVLKGIRHPDDGSLVHVRYAGMLEDGTIF